MKSMEQSNKNFWQREAFEIFVQTSGWIVGPIVIAAILGSWLDGQYGKKSWFLIICVAVAFIITNIGLVRMAIKTSRKMEKIIKAEKAKE